MWCFDHEPKVRGRVDRAASRPPFLLGHPPPRHASVQSWAGVGASRASGCAQCMELPEHVTPVGPFETPLLDFAHRCFARHLTTCAERRVEALVPYATDHVRAVVGPPGLTDPRAVA